MLLLTIIIIILLLLLWRFICGYMKISPRAGKNNLRHFKSRLTRSRHMYSLRTWSPSGGSSAQSSSFFTSWTSQPLFAPTYGWAPGATTKWLTVRLTPNWRKCALEYMERSASVKVLRLSSRGHRVDQLTDFIIFLSFGLLQLVRCFFVISIVIYDIVV